MTLVQIQNKNVNNKMYIKKLLYFIHILIFFNKMYFVQIFNQEKEFG